MAPGDRQVDSDSSAVVAVLPQDASNDQGGKPPCSRDTMALRVKKLSSFASLPERGSARAAGYDLFSAYDYEIAPHGREIVKTDITIGIPDGCYARVAPRSGLAVKHMLDTGAGVVDADYRGNLGVVLFNFGEKPFQVARGDRIAQLILERIYTPDVVEVEDLDVTARGAGGFGSSGQRKLEPSNQ